MFKDICDKDFINQHIKIFVEYRVITDTEVIQQEHRIGNTIEGKPHTEVQKISLVELMCEWCNIFSYLFYYS